MVKLGYIIASKQVVIEGKDICWLYRENPSDEYDSGWRVFSGQEDQEYSDNPDNFAIYDYQTIIDLNDEIKKLLDSPVGSEYERSSDGQFHLVSS